MRMRSQVIHRCTENTKRECSTTTVSIVVLVFNHFPGVIVVFVVVIIIHLPRCVVIHGLEVL